MKEVAFPGDYFYIEVSFCQIMEKQKMKYKVNIVIEKDQNGYYAYCPELKGCHSQGDTFEEVMEHIKEAIDLYLETLTREDIQTCLSKEILNTTFEVEFA